jgi:hypothetical protein
MTIAALRRLLDQELPDVPRHPAPRLPRQHFTAKESPTVTTAPAPRPAPDAEPTASADVRLKAVTTTEQLPVDQLLAWGDQHDDPDVQDQAARARALLTGLSRRHAADRELAQITTEAERLEQRLAALRAREAELAPPKKAKKTPTQRDYDPATVRAWAQQAGVNCPDRGRVPKTVVDAWRASHPAA